MHLQLCSISKRIGRQPLLQQVDLDLPPGSTHTLLGGRGAGKTTLLQIISGMLKQDEGTLHLDGAPFAPRSPREALLAGIGLIGEHPVLAPHLTVEENLLLGREPAEYGVLRRADRRAMALAALEPIRGSDISLDAPAGYLTLSQQRRVELARTLLAAPKLLLFDAPKKPLSAVDLETLLQIAQTLTSQGSSVLIASRGLDENRIGRYTILRDGIVVDAGELASLQPAAALRAMGGAAPESPTPFRTTHHIGAPVLELQQIGGRTMPRQVSLTLRKGEIFGLAGVPGAGRAATMRLLFGLAPIVEGSILLDGQPLHRTSAHHRFKSGLGFLSGDTLHQEKRRLDPIESLLFTHLSRLGLPGWFSWTQLRALADEWIRRFHQHGVSPERLLRDLSSGNRRMLALGRLFQDGSRILLLDDPTSGITPSARRRIHEWMGELAAQGKSILFSSPNVPELLALCDTIGVMRHGALVSTRPAKEWSEAELVHLATGGPRGCVIPPHVL